MSATTFTRYKRDTKQSIRYQVKLVKVLNRRSLRALLNETSLNLLHLQVDVKRAY